VAEGTVAGASLREILEDAVVQLDAGGDAAVVRDKLRRARGISAAAEDRYALGVALLRASNGREGWDLYDLHPSRDDDRLDHVMRWDGRQCRVLLIVAEQGFGDAIQFIRYVPMARRCADSVVVAVHDDLLALVKSSPALAGTEIIAKSALRRRLWDSNVRWERLMSLPKYWPNGYAEGIPRYLRTPSGPLLPPTDACITVGVAWRSTSREGVHDRSIPASLISLLLARPGIRLVSLHRPGDVSDRPASVIQPPITGFPDTAAVAAQCDLVVTADTVTAHLVPALGVPTFICLRRWPDWRWGWPTSPTRWYDNAELVFQDDSRQWPSVFTIIAQRINAARGREEKRVEAD
jgi:hypothetical protein